MAESRAKRMQVVLTLVQRQEDDAAQRLNQFREQLAGEEQQLMQLRDYAAQYMQDYSGQRQGVYAHQLINLSGFIQRLGDLCQEQELKIKRMQTQLDKLQLQWRVAHQKRKALEELIERLKYEEAAVADKRLQKELDELSAQALLRRSDDD